MVPDQSPFPADLYSRCCRRGIGTGATHTMEDQSAEDRRLDRGSRIGFTVGLQASRPGPTTLDSQEWVAASFVGWLCSRQAHAGFCKAASCRLFTNQNRFFQMGTCSADTTRMNVIMRLPSIPFSFSPLWEKVARCD